MLLQEDGVRDGIIVVDKTINILINNREISMDEIDFFKWLIGAVISHYDGAGYLYFTFRKTETPLDKSSIEFIEINLSGLVEFTSMVINSVNQELDIVINNLFICYEQFLMEIKNSIESGNTLDQTRVKNLYDRLFHITDAVLKCIRLERTERNIFEETEIDVEKKFYNPNLGMLIP